MEDPFRVWPITWSVDPTDVHRSKARCESEQEALAKALEIVWAKMENLGSEPSRERYVANLRKHVRNRDYEEQVTSHKKAREKLEDEETAIYRRFTENMLDALYPTGNQGWCPTVKYQIWPLCEDLRGDLNPAELMLMRAQIHRSEEASGMPADESPEDEDDET